MNWDAIAFDWNQARAFLATVEEGSLSAAARALGQTQPTLSRQVAELEADLGVTLFERVGRRLKLTDAGLGLVDHFQAMRDAATQISLGASGRALAVEGPVTVTATEFTAVHVLPPIIAKLRDRAPGITLTLVVSNEVQNLMLREADISIRHGRPEQPDLIARLVGETTVHIYGARSYLDRIGRPAAPEDLAGAMFVGFERPDMLVPLLTGLGLPVTAANFPIVTASGATILALVRQGLGLALMTREMAAREPDLEMVLPDLPVVPVPTWLVTHRELHTSRRIRLVYDLLADELAAWAKTGSRCGDRD